MRKTCCIIGMALLLILSGCWDQHLLKDVTLIKSAGIDLLDDKYLVSVTVRSTQEQTKAQEVTVSSPRTMQIMSNTISESRELLDQRMEHTYNSSKLEVLVLGEDVAKDEIELPLDAYYRNPRSSLSTKLVITEGQAQDVIKLGENRPVQTGEYIADLLNSLEHETTIPNENIQSISARLLSEGEDITLPLITPINETSVKVLGLALFNGTKYTGKIEHQLSTLFLLMNGNLNKSARFTKKIRDSQEVNIANYTTVNVTNLDRDLQVIANSVDDIQVKIDLKLKLDIIELPVNEPTPISEIRKLDRVLSDLLTEEAKEVTDILQKANSDALGIGKRLHAFHHDIWEQIEWKEVHPNITYDTNIDVQIDQRGILY